MLFEEGLQLVPQIEEKLASYALHLDRHRALVFYYKIASLYFGSGRFGTAIDYLNKIINWNYLTQNLPSTSVTDQLQTSCPKEQQHV